MELIALALVAGLAVALGVEKSRTIFSVGFHPRLATLGAMRAAFHKWAEASARAGMPGRALGWATAQKVVTGPLGAFLRAAHFVRLEAHTEPDGNAANPERAALPAIHCAARQNEWAARIELFPADTKTQAAGREAKSAREPVRVVERLHDSFRRVQRLIQPRRKIGKTRRW